MGLVLTETASRVAVLFSVLAVLLPMGFVTSANPSAAVTVTVLAVALAAVARVCTRGVELAVGVGSVARWTSHEYASTSSARVTDTLHHPLRPRAPGLA